MISTFRKSVRLGYNQTGGAIDLRLDEFGGRLLVLGGKANEMASLFAYAAHEAGLRPLVLDLDGGLAPRISGYFASYLLSDVLYDLYRIDETAPREHAELISSAYTAALDLTFEEEAILDAAMQKLASQDYMASPPVVYDALSGVEGFRGFYVDKLKGRIGTLKWLDAADSVSASHVLGEPGGAFVNLSSGMPRSAELGAALFVAKLVSAAGLKGAEVPIDFVLVSGVHRLFRPLPKSLHGNRLLTAVLGSGVPCVLVSDQGQALSSLVTAACPTKILSADAWFASELEKRHGSPATSPSLRGDRPSKPPPIPVLSNSYVLLHGTHGSTRPFITRPFEARSAPGSSNDGIATPGEGDKPVEFEGDPALVKRVLQETGGFESPSIPSLVSYLSAEFRPEDTQKAIDDLEKRGFLRLSPKEQRSGRTILCLALTPEGLALLGRLA